MNKNNSLIISDLENRPSVEFYPDITTRLQYDNLEYSLAELLTWLRSFNDLLHIARDELQLIKLIHLPKPLTLRVLVSDILLSIPDKKQKLLKNLGQEILIKYKLGDYWATSIEVCILTNVLLAPIKDSIYFHIPENLYPIKEKVNIKTGGQGLLKTLSDIDYEELSRINFLGHEVRMKYPAIILTRYTSPTELKKWITDNAKLLRHIQKHLGQSPTIKIDKRTAFWGKTAWILKEEGINSWTKMVNEIDSWDDKKPIINDEEILPIPTPNELEKCFTSFYNSLQRIEK